MIFKRNKNPSDDLLENEFAHSHLRKQVEDAAVELDNIVAVLNDNPNFTIEMGSHTDARGSDKYNQWLSQQRAESAVK